jgi:hypothetical protein
MDTLSLIKPSILYDLYKTTGVIVGTKKEFFIASFPDLKSVYNWIKTDCPDTNLFENDDTENLKSHVIGLQSWNVKFTIIEVKSETP